MEALIAQDGTIFNWHNIVSVKETMDGILAGLVVDGYVCLRPTTTLIPASRL